MKTLLRFCLIASFALAGTASAGASCESSCESTVKMCTNACKDLKSQGHGDKVTFCQTKCKEFENVCKQNCQNKPKKK